MARRNSVSLKLIANVLMKTTREIIKRIVGCLLLIMATANIAEAIDSDLDLDKDNHSPMI